MVRRGDFMRRKPKSFMPYGTLDGKRVRGKTNKYLEGLATWHNRDKHTDLVRDSGDWVR